MEQKTEVNSKLNLRGTMTSLVSTTIKMTPVQKQMLVDMARKYRMKMDDLIAEMIEETYSTKKKR